MLFMYVITTSGGWSSPQYVENLEDSIPQDIFTRSHDDVPHQCMTPSAWCGAPNKRLGSLQSREGARLPPATATPQPERTARACLGPTLSRPAHPNSPLSKLRAALSTALGTLS